MRSLISLRWLAGLALTLVWAGCAAQRVDFTPRIGTMTFDHAVVELGPPDKQAKLTDGTLVAEWLTRRGRGATYLSSRGFGGYPGWPSYSAPAYYEPATPDYFLRLSFGPDGKLAAWKHYPR